MSRQKVLPASAGMIPGAETPTGEVLCAPRIRGDDPSPWTTLPCCSRCSPHPRG